jgi:hypothetical protein
MSCPELAHAVCVGAGCCTCCFCGERLKDGWSQLKHVMPPEAPVCSRSDTGHEPLTFPQPEPSRSQADNLFSAESRPAHHAIVNGVIAVRMCKLCGLLYWEPLKGDDD